ncbi:exodeoxyribonuclease V subunit alpha [Geobacter sp. SVR]|uniref:exodeoxyribonuclease V subunit alpha n=1 Tax=Geobacter sp. SVR TaxID=2495594 RepID=UPI00143EF887|nr:exodeoxyribonuclease V subunit alpha [Geobacter sp. SVR]BCS52155.1 RecBCD enzyme subunit RecD [Geobacter sp. SVR]GCF86610.1 RecBCD enzyme subunit RecD [Geobacter sp. SVR]
MNDPIQLSVLDHHFADFINGIDDSPGRELWLAAALTSAAASRGHACLDLAEGSGQGVLPFQPGERLLTPQTEPWQQVLAACSTVGQPGDYTPLVLDGAGRLYLHRSWNHECLIAEGILARSAAVTFDRELLQKGLDRYFPSGDGQTDWQRVAATAAVTRGFTVVSGGPGTGKTTTVARILALLIEQAGARDLRIALTAPTGKAAMRLRQSILQAIERLELSDEVRERIPDDVQTIHRLLGVSGSTGFRHNRSHPLECDLLVVDEVSMVDLPLMARLLDALPLSARVILLGDRDQLASVEAGAVLADICNHGRQVPFSEAFRSLLRDTGTPLPDAEPASGSAHAPLADAVVQLRTSYRFGDASAIGTVSRLINAGEAGKAFDLLQSGSHADLLWRQIPEGAAFEEAFAAAVTEGYAPYAAATSPEAGLEQLERFRVLSPYREGLGGVRHLNRLAEHALGLRRPEGQTCSGLAVMVTGNSYELGLFNGDTAVLMKAEDNDRMTAFFSDPHGGLRSLSPLRLPPWEPAFALTVHKSQGSEFDRVLLILPDRISEALSRELLYTAVTRARSRIEIWGTEEALRFAVERRIVRNSGLRDRLWI